MATKKSQATKSMDDWIVMVEEWFSNLPSLPANARIKLVTITPWIALIFGIVGVLVGLAGLGALTAFSPLIAMSSGFGGVAGSLIFALLGIVSGVLLLAGFSGTRQRKLQGWKMLFWSGAINMLVLVLRLSIPGVIVVLALFYLLFQIKSYYK